MSTHEMDKVKIITSLDMGGATMVSDLDMNSCGICNAESINGVVGSVLSINPASGQWVNAGAKGICGDCVCANSGFDGDGASITNLCTDGKFLPLAGGTMTGDIDMGLGCNIRNTFEICSTASSALTLRSLANDVILCNDDSTCWVRAAGGQGFWGQSVCATSCFYGTGLCHSGVLTLNAPNNCMNLCTDSSHWVCAKRGKGFKGDCIEGTSKVIGGKVQTSCVCNTNAIGIKAAGSDLTIEGNCMRLVSDSGNWICNTQGKGFMGDCIEASTGFFGCGQKLTFNGQATGCSICLNSSGNWVAYSPGGLWTQESGYACLNQNACIGGHLDMQSNIICGVSGITSSGTDCANCYCASDKICAAGGFYGCGAKLEFDSQAQGCSICLDGSSNWVAYTPSGLWADKSGYICACNSCKICGPTGFFGSELKSCSGALTLEAGGSTLTLFASSGGQRIDFCQDGNLFTCVTRGCGHRAPNFCATDKMEASGNIESGCCASALCFYGDGKKLTFPSQSDGYVATYCSSSSCWYAAPPPGGVWKQCGSGIIAPCDSCDSLAKVNAIASCNNSGMSINSCGQMTIEACDSSNNKCWVRANDNTCGFMANRFASPSGSNLVLESSVGGSCCWIDVNNTCGLRATTTTKIHVPGSTLELCGTDLFLCTAGNDICAKNHLSGDGCIETSVGFYGCGQKLTFNNQAQGCSICLDGSDNWVAYTPSSLWTSCGSGAIAPSSSCTQLCKVNEIRSCNGSDLVLSPSPSGSPCWVKLRCTNGICDNNVMRIHATSGCLELEACGTSACWIGITDNTLGLCHGNGSTFNIRGNPVDILSSGAGTVCSCGGDLTLGACNSGGNPCWIKIGKCTAGICGCSGQSTTLSLCHSNGSVDMITGSASMTIRAQANCSGAGILRISSGDSGDGCSSIKFCNYDGSSCYWTEALCDKSCGFYARSFKAKGANGRFCGDGRKLTFPSQSEGYVATYCASNSCWYAAAPPSGGFTCSLGSGCVGLTSSCTVLEAECLHPTKQINFWCGSFNGSICATTAANQRLTIAAGCHINLLPNTGGGSGTLRMGCSGGWLTGATGLCCCMCVCNGLVFAFV